MLLLTPTQDIFYPAAEYIHDQLLRYCLATDKNTLAVLNGSSVYHLDASAAKVFFKTNLHLHLTNSGTLFSMELKYFLCKYMHIDKKINL